MGRKLEFCREKALHTAMESFWAQGYEHTSMRDLAAKLGLHLGSVYNALGDKEKVFEAALKLHFDEHVVPEMTRLTQAEDPLAALDAMMVRAIEQCSGGTNAPGCFLINSLLEITSINDNVSTLLREYMVYVENGIKACLENAQKKQQMKPDMDATTYSRFVMSAFFSMRTLAKLNMPAEQLHDIRRCTLRAIAA